MRSLSLIAALGAVVLAVTLFATSRTDQSFAAYCQNTLAGMNQNCPLPN